MLASPFANTMSIFFFIASTFILSIAISRIVTMSPSCQTGLPTADCIFEMSSSWFTKASNCCPCRSTISNCCLSSGDSAFCLRCSDIPLIIVKGVRNSWVMFVKKSLLIFSMLAWSFCERLRCFRA